jgi:twitching motility protein PilJ
MAMKNQAGIGLFSRLLLWQKFVILGVIAVILVAVPFGLYWAEAQKTISAAKRETDGTAPAVALLNVVRLTQQHRGLSTLVLGGNVASVPNREAKRKEVSDAVAAMDAIVKTIPNRAIVDDWAAIKQRWQKLHSQVDQALIKAPQSFQEHSELIADSLDVLDKLSDHFGLSLDPEAETYFMIQAILYSNPALTETLGKMRALGAGILAQKQAAPGELQRLSGLVDLAEAQRKVAITTLQKAFAISPKIKGDLEALTTDAGESFLAAIKLVKQEVLEAPQLAYPPSDYFDAYTKTIDAYAKRNEKGMDLLAELLEDKVRALRFNQFAVGAGILALFFLASAFVYYISRSITRPVGYLVSVMNKLASGDSTVRANLESFDEIGVLGRQFDMMVDQREAVSARIQHENETLNNSVIELLQAVAKLSQRDLTVKVPVAEDITGPVADALNLLSDETAKVLNRVTDIAQNVAQISRQVKAQSDTVILVATEEKREVEQTAADLNRASEVMQEIAQLARACNDAAERAIKTTERAQDTVLGTVQGITTIRDTIRETEKRIKRLGERSQEIGGVVNLINSIAERTHILALNASMHAASAGEAGRGFAVVANEVQRLAENAREATSKIAGLVNNIQVETADTVTTMNDAISQVVRGTELAQKAGSEMRETRDTTSDLVQLVQRIAEDSMAQAQTTQQLRERAIQIQKSTEETYEQLQDQGLQTERLVSFSGGLVESVGVFVLPKVA